MNDFELTMVYNIGNIHTLDESKVERDLGVYIQNDLKWKEQIRHTCNKAYNMMSTLKRIIKYWDKTTFIKLYCTFIRSHLEYCIPAWNPTSKRDIELLERVQRRVTKLVPCL